MDTADINTPTEEPVVDQQRRGTHAEREMHHDEETQERLRKLSSELPWWLAEKFHWHASVNGFVRLRPNSEYLAAVEADAPKFEMYGFKLNHPDNGPGTTEAGLVDALTTEMACILDSVVTLDDREAKALRKFITDRCTSNCVYAATNQFEIDQWTARAARQDKDASKEENFGEKESRRDSFAAIGAVWGEVARKLFDDIDLSDQVFVRSARSAIYMQADMRGREQLNPQQEKEQDTAKAAAAVAASRPI